MAMKVSVVKDMTSICILKTRFHVLYFPMRIHESAIGAA
jgi:hypothetical protein